MCTYRVFLEDEEVDVDVVNNEGRTPLHYAVAYGHAAVAEMLLDAGADPNIEDNIGTKAVDIMNNPGPISASDALKYLGVTQRKVRIIYRYIYISMYVYIYEYTYMFIYVYIYMYICTHKYTYIYTYTCRFEL
jgi:hypothetical protein